MSNITVLVPTAEKFEIVNDALIRAIHDIKELQSSIDTICSMPANLSLDGQTENFKTMLEDSVLTIIDISDNDPSSLHFLGIAQTLKANLLLIMEQNTKSLITLFHDPYLIYNEKHVNEYVSGHFKAAIKRLLDDGGYLPKTQSIKSGVATNELIRPVEYVEAAPSEAKFEKTTVFISYSHKDTSYLDRLNVHLKPLERKELINAWSDKRLQSGDKFKEVIEKELNQAAIAILLISADFLASDFIVNNELQPLLKNAASKGTQIIPVVVHHCSFLRNKELNVFQAINNPERPLSDCNPGEQEKIYDLIAERIEVALGSM